MLLICVIAEISIVALGQRLYKDESIDQFIKYRAGDKVDRIWDCMPENNILKTFYKQQYGGSFKLQNDLVFREIHKCEVSIAMEDLKLKLRKSFPALSESTLNKTIENLDSQNSDPNRIAEIMSNEHNFESEFVSFLSELPNNADNLELNVEFDRQVKRLQHRISSDNNEIIETSTSLDQVDRNQNKYSSQNVSEDNEIEKTQNETLIQFIYSEFQVILEKELLNNSEEKIEAAMAFFRSNKIGETVYNESDLSVLSESDQIQTKLQPIVAKYKVFELAEEILSIKYPGNNAKINKTMLHLQSISFENKVHNQSVAAITQVIDQAIEENNYSECLVNIKSKIIDFLQHESELVRSYFKENNCIATEVCNLKLDVDDDGWKRAFDPYANFANNSAEPNYAESIQDEIDVTFYEVILSTLIDIIEIENKTSKCILDYMIRENIVNSLYSSELLFDDKKLADKIEPIVKNYNQIYGQRSLIRNG